MEIKNKICQSELASIFEISKQQFENESWTFEQFKSSFSSPSTIFLIAKDHKEINSFLIAQDLIDSINILLIATKKEKENNGYGKKLLESLIEKYPHKKIWLEVKEDNEKAIRFYSNNGFVYIYERKKYYKDGKNAIILEFKK